MAWLEQIPVEWEQIVDSRQETWESTEIADANVVTNENKENQEGWWDAIKTDNELSEKEAEERSNEILKDEDSKNQINQLKSLWEKYENGELKDEQKTEYENLMGTIKAELDRDIPKVIEMDKEINDYYESHPEQAEADAINVVNNPNAKKDILLVAKVVKAREYLEKEKQDKLNTVIKNEINKLDENTKSVLEMKKDKEERKE